MPVRKEKLVVDHGPVDSAQGGYDAQTHYAGGAGDEGTPAEVSGDSGVVQEIVLHEERPVVQTETVATERVRIGTESVTTEEEIVTPVRREHVAVEHIDPDGTRHRATAGSLQRPACTVRRALC